MHPYLYKYFSGQYGQRTSLIFSHCFQLGRINFQQARPPCKGNLCPIFIVSFSMSDGFCLEQYACIGQCIPECIGRQRKTSTASVIIASNRLIGFLRPQKPITAFDYSQIGVRCFRKLFFATQQYILPLKQCHERYGKKSFWSLLDGTLFTGNTSFQGDLLKPCQPLSPKGISCHFFCCFQHKLCCNGKTTVSIHQAPFPDDGFRLCTAAQKALWLIILRWRENGFRLCTAAQKALLDPDNNIGYCRKYRIHKASQILRPKIRRLLELFQHCPFKCIFSHLKEQASQLT